MEIKELIELAFNVLKINVAKNTKDITKSTLIEAIINEDTVNIAHGLGYSNTGDGGFKRFRNSTFPVRPKIIRSYKIWLLSVVGYKICPGCYNVLEIGLFSKNTSYCKSCDSVTVRDTEKRKLRIKEHYLNNKTYYLLKNIKRRLYIKQQMPEWVDEKEIYSFYSKCPEGYHVDHIIPLKNNLVSGLHVISNLQYLPAKENLIKSNKFNMDFLTGHTCPS